MTTQPFILKLTDNVNTVDFLSSNVRVMDGGFDIGMPKVTRSLAQYRPGFYIPLSTDYEYREAKLRFAITGTTRSDVLVQVSKIENIFRQAAAQNRTNAGRRVELSYAWAGSNQITYFEVYGGDISFPDDVLSVAQVHASTEGKPMLPDVELTLTISPYGYGVSLYSNNLIQVPLSAPLAGTRIMGGVTIQNPNPYNANAYNYVEIAGSDLQGGSPFLTRLELATGESDFSSFAMLYFGLQQSPYPTKIAFNSNSDLAEHTGLAHTIENDGQGGTYFHLSAVRMNHSLLSQWSFSVTNSSAGMFMAVMHLFQPSAAMTDWLAAIGIDDYISFGIRYQEDYVKNGYGGPIFPLGSLQLPPTRLGLKDQGTIDPSLRFGIWCVHDSDVSDYFDFHYLSLLPVSNGFRALRARRSLATAGTYIDDAWQGLEYFKTGAGVVSSPLFGMQEPLKLEPNVDQRIYYTGFGPGTAESEMKRNFKLKVFVVPTFLSLAM